MFAFYRHIRPRCNESHRYRANFQPCPGPTTIPPTVTTFIVLSLCIDISSKAGSDGVAPTTCHATNSIMLDTGWRYTRTSYLSLSYHLFPVISSLLSNLPGNIRTRSASNGKPNRCITILIIPQEDELRRMARGYNAQTSVRDPIISSWYKQRYDQRENEDAE